MPVTRYAIQLGPDTFSSGPTRKAVGLEKAKMWSNIGHVKTHIGTQPTGYRAYPASARVVEVQVTFSVTPIVKDGEFVTPVSIAAEALRKRDEKRAFWEREAAVRRLERAEKELVEAHKRIEQMRLEKAAKDVG